MGSANGEDYNAIDAAIKPLVIPQGECSGGYVQLRGILISGLRRSGTTVFWESFRQDQNNCCIDEPFHPELWSGLRQNNKDTWTELGEVWGLGNEPPVAGALPIHPYNELDPPRSVQQYQYLNQFYSSDRRGVVDSVRIWPRLGEFVSHLDSVFVIHLVRHPKTWVTAHLLPSNSNPSWRRKLTNVYRRNSFFRRGGLYNNWHYQDIIEHSFHSTSGQELWRAINLDPSELSSAPAFIKLLAFWWAATVRSEIEIAQLCADRHMILSMDEFIANPQETIEAIYDRCGWELPTSLNFDHVRQQRKSWEGPSVHWEKGMHYTGIPEAIFEAPVFTGKSIRDCLPRYQS